LLGDYQPADLEKLEGHDVYSFRLNGTGRLLFVTHRVAGQDYLLLLEALPTHDYVNSRFLKHGVLKRYLGRMGASLAAAAVANPRFIAMDDRESAELMARLQHPAFGSASAIPLEYFKQEFIQLSDEQQGAVRMSLPTVISGEAGSGKSCVAISILAEHAARVLHAGTAAASLPLLLYLCESDELVESMKAEWREHSLAVTLPAGIVQFKTYNQLLQEQGLLQWQTADGQPRNQAIVGRADFEAWYKTYMQGLYKQSRVLKIPFCDIPAEIAYQEFRICSSHDDEASYLKLGDKQSLLSREQKSQLYKAYLAYRDDCEQRHSVHPAFFNRLWREQYDLVVVDEAQDLSNLQLERAHALAKHGAVAYCIDSHQSLHDKRSKRPYLLHMLREKGACSHVELTITYRCPTNIARAASEVVKLKQCLARGIGDQFESKGLISAKNENGLEGGVLLFDNKTISASKWGPAHKKGTDFAVIIPSDGLLREEAKKLFNTALVFTPEEIKGLEYVTVVAYQLFDEDIFARIYRKTQEEGYSSVQPEHRAKPGNDEEFSPFLNKIYTSFTRAKTTLIICQEPTRHNEVLLTPLRATVTKDDAIKQKVIAKTSANDWLEEAKRLRSKGERYRQQAFDIYRTELGQPVGAFNVFWEGEHSAPDASAAAASSAATIAEVLPKAAASAAPVKSNTSVKIKDALKPKPLSPALQAITILLKKFTEKNAYACFSRKDVDLQALSTPVEIPGEPTLPFFCHVMRCFKRRKCLDNCLKAYPGVAEKLCTLPFFKAIQQQGEQAKLSGHGLEALLLDLVAYNPCLLEKRDVVRWLESSLKHETAALLLHELAALPSLFLQLVRLFPKIMKGIPAEAWWQLLPAENDISASSLYWLTCYDVGREILIELFKDKKFIEKIFAEAWFESPNAAGTIHAGASTIYHLTRTNGGLDLLTKLLENPKFLAVVVNSVWFLPVTCSNGLENTSPISNLCNSQNSRVILKRLLSIPGFLEIFPLELLGLARTKASGALEGTSILYWLTAVTDGRDILRILAKTPNFLARIPIQSWYLALTPFGGNLENSTPLSNLISSEGGQDFLYDLIANNADWAVAIPMSAWELKLSKGHKEYANMSLLMILAKSERGRAILGLLKAIHAENPVNIKIINEILPPEEKLQLSENLAAGRGLFQPPSPKRAAASAASEMEQFRMHGG
jgi:hypothetical protein